MVSVLAVMGMAASTLGVLFISPAGAGNGVPTTIAVAKTVDGPATGPFSVEVTCDESVAILEFDASGAPTTSSGDGMWEIVGGMWQLSFGNSEPLQCSATETDADGATSTTWTCTFDLQTVNGFVGGCAAPDGVGVGPVNFDFAGNGQGVDSQRALVRFTNVIAPPEPPEPQPEPIVVGPTFTG
jgi:hypothetical protein